MKNYTLHPTLLFRVPLLPFDGYIQTIATLPDFSQQKQALKSIFTQPIVQEALFLASPTLWETATKWTNGEAMAIADENKLAYSLLRYVARMSARPTPFGLFAGCVLGSWADENKVLLHTPDAHKKTTRPDMHYLSALAQHLARHEHIRPYLRFFSNNSLYASGERWRYVDYFYHQNRRKHQISAIDQSDYTTLILENAQQGATLHALAMLLVSEDITIAEATAFINEMADAQVLISETDGNTTGEAMLDRLIAIMNRIEQDKNINPDHIATIRFYHAELQRLKAALQHLDQQKLGLTPFFYKELADSLTKMNVPFELNLLFQTDMSMTVTQCTLRKKVAADIRRALEILNKLTPKRNETPLQQFAQAFSERYETKEIPLSQVLDIETGIGYPVSDAVKGDINPLVDGLPIGFRIGENPLTLDKTQHFLLDKLIAAHRTEATVIRITDEEVKIFTSDWSDLPDSLAIMASILEKNGVQQVQIIAASGSATHLTGRFTHTDPLLHNWVADIAQKEQALHEEAILAEIVHLPESRVGNVLMRTHFRAYEIPYLAQSTLPKAYQIPLDDLMVSVQHGEIILRSKRLNKRILPNLGNAHNYSNNALPVYHFLCDMQQQGKRGGLYFGIKQAGALFPYLPRVMYENVILSRATWQLKKMDIEALFVKTKDDVTLFANFQQWQQRHKLPNQFLFIEGDNELFIQADCLLSIKMFISEIKLKNAIELAEFLWNETNSIVQNKEKQHFTNQFIAVFHKEKVEKSPLPFVIPSDKLPFKRTFAIGSEWLYFKIYCGAATADEILCEQILPLVQEFTTKNWIDYWFFIRFADPKTHIRIRFHVKNMRFLQPILSRLYKNLDVALSQKKVGRIQTDTYEREVERYGEATMLLSEQLFCADSISTLLFLKELDNFTSAYRWLYGLGCIDAILVAFEYDAPRKAALIEKLKASFGKEFGMNKHLRKQINDKFKQHEALMNTFYDVNDETNEHIIAIRLHIHTKIRLYQPFIKGILQATNYDSLDNLMISYLHMFVNRLFKSKQRLYELVLYEFICKKYQPTHIKNNAIIEEAVTEDII
jgi:lantibiotic biosynthesis protein